MLEDRINSCPLQSCTINGDKIVRGMNRRPSWDVNPRNKIVLKINFLRINCKSKTRNYIVFCRLKFQEFLDVVE